MSVYQKTIIIFLSFFLLLRCESSGIIANETSKIMVNEPETTISSQSPFGFLTSFHFPKRKNKEDMKKQRMKMQYDWASGDNPHYATALDLGVAWERPTHPIIDWAFVQRDIQSIKQGSFNWSVSDGLLKRVPPGINLVVTINVGKSRVKPGTWKFPGPEGKFIAKYGEFVQKVVERYDGDGIDDMPGLKNPIKFWQIENEPVSNIKRAKGKRPTPNLDWEGFAQIVEASYKSIKRADNTAKVLSAGVVSAPPGKTDQLFDEFWKPLINKLNGNYIDIFDFHWFKEWDTSYPFYTKIRKTLDGNGFSRTPVWITETGASSRTGEKKQAIDMVRRMIYPLSYGVKKVFWAWSLVEGWPPFDCKSMFDYTGLIYDGHCEGDPGYGVKKLAYYTYRQMTHRLSNKDFSRIQTILKGENNIHAFKLSSASQDIYVVWWAHEEEKTSSKTLLNLPVSGNGKYTLVETIPHFSGGKDISQGQRDLFNSQDIIVSNNILTCNITPVPVYIIKNH